MRAGSPDLFINQWLSRVSACTSPRHGRRNFSVNGISDKNMRTFIEIVQNARVRSLAETDPTTRGFGATSAPSNLQSC